MALSCPRCDATLLDLQTVTPADSEQAVDVHVCPSCHGLWMDKETVAPVCPTVAHLPERAVEVSLTGRRAGDLTTCPRCHAAPYAMDLLGVTIDVCIQCGGVWLDGDEYEEAELGVQKRGRRRRVEDAYRAAPAGPEQHRSMRCAYCGQPVAEGKEYVRERGVACGRCHMHLEQELTRLRDEADELGGLVQWLFDRINRS